MTQKPTRHKRIRADLKAYTDGELSPLARFFVTRHLRACPSCREELIQMQTLSTELRENETEETPLSSELRAHILENAPTTGADSFPEEIVERPRRVARKKMVLALGVTSFLLFIAFTTLTGSKVKNTFNKAADSMNTTDDAGSAPSIGIWGGSTGGGGAGSIAPTSIPGASSVASAGSAPISQPFNSTSAEVAAKIDAQKNANSQNGDGTIATFSDGHLKSQSSGSSATFQNGMTARRGANVDALRALSEVQQNKASIDYRSVPMNAPGAATDEASVVPATRAVHREGSLSVAVQNAESAGDDATNIIKNVGGFVVNNSLETGAGQHRTAVLDCRVPVTQFEAVVKKIGALGVVRAKSVNGQDITAQVAQSGARRQTLSNELSIAQARLAQKEKSRKPDAADLYELRAEVRTLRIQASQARAALETLQKYGSLSSLYVSLQDGLPSATPHAASWFDSLSPTSQAAWNSFLTNARLPLQLLLWILAYSPFWLPALIIWRKYGRKWLTE